ncbi:MAG: replicative DNA helicase [Dehalococcoidia bacterium]|nr:replicative DNA helicase [Dehalococcoidia bacterium]
MAENGSVAEERLPPQNVEAEQSVLGSILIDRDAVARVAAFLRAEDYYRQQHQVIYNAALDLFERREPADLVTLTDELQRRDRLDKAGGASYLSSLIALVPTAVHVEYYGRIVERCAMLRRLIQASGQIAALAYGSTDAEEAVDQAESILFQLTQRRRFQEFLPLKTLLEDYFDQIDFIHQHRGQTLGVPTGFRDLDALTGGLQRSDLIIVAARPSMGKTSLALNIGQNAASPAHNVPVAIFSLEMSKEQLVQRLICTEALIDSHRLRRGLINDDELQKIAKAIGRLSEVPVYIDDTAGIPIMELRTKARRLQAEHNIGLILIDYLQLMQGQGRYMENRVQEVSEITRSLKGLARELNIPIVAMSQLSRAVEQRPSHIPMLSDLRESGSIEQDADVVMFIYREDYYDKDTPKKDLADILIAKHRNGPTGELQLRFFSQQTRFADLETRQHSYS